MPPGSAHLHVPPLLHDRIRREKVVKQALLKRGGGEPSEKILGSISFPVREEGEKGKAKIPGERGGGGRGKRFWFTYG